MKQHNILTPTLADFAAGRTIAPLWVAPNGRKFYPIAGGAPDGDTSGGDAGAAASAGAAAGTAAAAGGATGGTDDGKGEGTGSTGGSTDDPPKGGDQGTGDDSDKGFPPNTKVADMKPAEQIAYHQYHARKHETRNQELLRITGGKFGDALKAELDELARLRQERMTDSEKAIEQAKTETRAALAPERVRDAFDLLLGDMPESERNDQLDLLDLTKFVTSDGRVDTAKVRQFAEKIHPAKGGSGGSGDYGQGHHGNRATSGVAAGRTRYAERHGKSVKDS